MKTEAVIGHTKPKPGKVQGCRQPPEASLKRILPPEGTHPASTLTPGLWPPGLQQNKLLVVCRESCPETHTRGLLGFAPLGVSVPTLGCSRPLHPPLL